MAFNGLSPAPELERAPFGLDSVADVHEHGAGPDDAHWAQGYRQENSLCHYKVGSWEPCTPGEVSPLYDSEGDAWQGVTPFFVQAEDTCKDSMHLKRPETRQKLLQLLDIVSWKALEHELWTGEHTQASSSSTGPLEGAENAYLEQAGAVSVGTGMTPQAGLASVIERLAYLLPGTLGIVHMSPGAAAVLGSQGLLEADGKIMRVKSTGNPVVIGTGYASDSGIQPAIYGTGAITVHVGPSRLITEDLTQGAVIAQNKLELVGERPVAVGWDGCVHVKAGLTF